MRNSRIIFFVVMIMTVAMMMIGCGKKGDPMPSDIKPASPASVLKLEKTSEAIVVYWPFNDKQRGAAFLKLEKSGLDPQGTDCPGCPRTFEIVAEISVDHPICKGGGHQQCRYPDYKLLKGHHYIYRLLSCNGMGKCEMISTSEELTF